MKPFMTTTINSNVYIEIQDNFLILSIENRFGEDEFISEEDNASCHKATEIKLFFRKGL